MLRASYRNQVYGKFGLHTQCHRCVACVASFTLQTLIWILNNDPDSDVSSMGPKFGPGRHVPTAYRSTQAQLSSLCCFNRPTEAERDFGIQARFSSVRHVSTCSGVYKHTIMSIQDLFQDVFVIRSTFPLALSLAILLQLSVLSLSSDLPHSHYDQ